MAEPQQIPEWSPNPYPNAIPMQQMNAQGDGGYAPQYYPSPQNFGQGPSAVPPQQQPSYAAPQQNNFNADVDKPAPMPSSAAAPEPERPYKAPRKEMPKKKKIAIIVGTIVPTVVVAAVILMIVFLRTELVIIQSANTKQDWMNAMATAFNAKQYRFSDGAIMQVQVNHTGSTFNAGLQPMIYSPAIMTWVDLTNAQWNQNFSANLVDKSKCKPTVSIPIGIAMWKHMAQSLGWPNKQIGWSDIADLARNSSKWSYGEFKYGHGQPESSNSGRLSIVGQIFAFTGQKTQLTLNDVMNPDVRSQVESIQQTVYHYGKIDTDLLDRMVQRGPDYLTAATSYESNVIRWNANNPNLPFPFVLIYPREGTFWNEHPMCVVEGASWSTPKQREAAQKFIDFVLEKEQQEATVQYGIRPANSDFDPSTIPNSPFKESNGVLPVTSETIPSLPYPSDDVTNAIIQLWIDTKKPASILLILDVSGSMQDENKITYAKQAAASFVNQMHDRDEIYVITFSSSYSFLLPGAQNNTLSVIRGQMASEISLLYPGGGTALFDSTIAGVNFMNNLKAGRVGTDQRYNYAVVLMTDGVDTSSTQYTFNSMMNALPNGESSDQIHVFTVAYGSDADKDSLKQIASRTNGKAYVASTTNILSIYSDIVLEF